MTKVCAFCGKELGIFDRNTLLAGNVSQPACQDCWNRLLDLPQGERARLALETGRAVEPEALRSFLEAEEAQRKEQREAERRRRATGLTCRYCGGPMLNFQRKHFNMGEEGLLGGIVARDGWLASFLELDMLSCQDCGRV